MKVEGNPKPAGTLLASAPRADQKALEAARRAFVSNDLAVRLLEAIPDPALVLDAQCRIIAANARLRSVLGPASLPEVFGLRLGEAVRCLHYREAEAGCGAGPFCVECGAVQVMLESFESRTSVSRECRLRSAPEGDEKTLDLEVQATFVEVAGTDLLVVTLRDLRAEKRRQVLDRVFFHDALNTAVALNTLAQFLGQGQHPTPREESRYKEDLLRVSEQMMEEIAAQRQLLAAEKGELRLSPSAHSMRALLESVVARVRPRDPEEPPRVVLAEAPESMFVTDVILLRRVLVSLVKNALEAIPEKERVTVRAREEGDSVVFEVHNPGAMPLAVQRQIFQPSFSTEEGYSRGVATYSIRLFTEHYLGGRLTFESRAPEGTTFWVRVPRESPIDQAS